MTLHWPWPWRLKWWFWGWWTFLDLEVVKLVDRSEKSNVGVTVLDQNNIFLSWKKIWRNLIALAHIAEWRKNTVMLTRVTKKKELSRARLIHVQTWWITVSAHYHYNVFSLTDVPLSEPKRNYRNWFGRKGELRGASFLLAPSQFPLSHGDRCSGLDMEKKIFK